MVCLHIEPREGQGTCGDTPAQASRGLSDFLQQARVPHAPADHPPRRDFILVRPRHTEGSCAQLHPALLASQGEGEQERYYARVGSARMFSPTANAPNRWAVRCSFAFMWPELTCD